ncbi:MAG: metallophosphoesterase [Lachnospiraceae bacterium]|nr:metallophosphoesterase [Lachnospiraceae bacterium]
MGYIILGICIAVALFFFIVNIRDMNRFVVREYTFTSDKIAKEGTFVFLSDLHNKSYGKENEKLLNAIHEVKPDVLLVGGDMIVASPGEGNDTAKAFMHTLAKNYTVYHGMGNHEYRSDLYREKYESMYDEYSMPLIEKGVVFLRNETVFLKEYNIRIRGAEIDRKYYKRFVVRHMENTYLEEILGKSDKECYEILLAHNPDYFRQYAAYGADLTLAGHVHGGIIRMPFVGGIASPAVRFFPRYNGGLYHRGDADMIVSCGLGTHTLPMRIFNPAELIVIHLKPACKDA